MFCGWGSDGSHNTITKHTHQHDVTLQIIVRTACGAGYASLRSVFGRTTEATPMTGPVMKCLRCTNEWKCQCARLPRNASEKQLITKRLSAHIIAIIVTSLIVRSVVRHAAANRPHCQRDEIPPKSQSCLRRCRRCRHRL